MSPAPLLPVRDAVRQLKQIGLRDVHIFVGSPDEETIPVPPHLAGPLPRIVWRAGTEHLGPDEGFRCVVWAVRIVGGRTSTDLDLTRLEEPTSCRLEEVYIEYVDPDGESWTESILAAYAASKDPLLWGNHPITATPPLRATPEEAAADAKLLWPEAEARHGILIRNGFAEPAPVEGQAS